MLKELQKQHEKLPQYYYVHLILILIWGTAYLLGLFNYLLVFYLLALFFSPHASWEVMNFLFWRGIRPFKGIPFSFIVTTTGVVFSRAFLIYPFETILYYLDEIFFPGYKNVEIKNPFMIVGQPRSGTTKLESILEEDKDLVCMKLYESRFPYLVFQYSVDLVCQLDASYLNGAISKFVQDNKLLHVFDENRSQRHQMRRLRYNLPDEDDLVFLFHFMYHFQFLSISPDPESARFLYYFESLSERERKRMLDFHKKSVQKLLYRRGTNKTYFAKWVMGWCGLIQQAQKTYPDMKLLVMVREPQDQVRSWLKLQGLLANELSTFDVLKQCPEVLEELKKISIQFYKKQIEFLQNTDRSKYFLMDFNVFYRDIQTNFREVYKFLGRKVKEGSEFEKFLLEQTQQQSTHKATSTDDSLITSEEISKNFPDLPRILFSEDFGKKKE